MMGVLFRKWGWGTFDLHGCTTFYCIESTNIECVRSEASFQKQHIFSVTFNVCIQVIGLHFYFRSIIKGNSFELHQQNHQENFEQARL